MKRAAVLIKSIMPRKRKTPASNGLTPGRKETHFSAMNDGSKLGANGFIVKDQSHALVFFEGNFYSRDQIKQILKDRKQNSRRRVYQRLWNKKRKPVIFYGHNTNK